MSQDLSASNSRVLNSNRSVLNSAFLNRSVLDSRFELRFGDDWSISAIGLRFELRFELRFKSLRFAFCVLGALSVSFFEN